MWVNTGDGFRFAGNNNKSFQVILIFSSAKPDIGAVGDDRLKSDPFGVSIAK